MSRSRIALSGEKFSLGRASSCDYSVKESDMCGIKWLQAVSKVQCEVFKTDKGLPFLKDLSTNGNMIKICLDFHSLLQGLGSTVRKLGRITSGLWSTTP